VNERSFNHLGAAQAPEPTAARPAPLAIAGPVAVAKRLILGAEVVSGADTQDRVRKFLAGHR